MMHRNITSWRYLLLAGLSIAGLLTSCGSLNALEPTKNSGSTAEISKMTEVKPQTSSVTKPLPKRISKKDAVKDKGAEVIPPSLSSSGAIKASDALVPPSEAEKAALLPVTIPAPPGDDPGDETKLVKAAHALAIQTPNIDNFINAMAVFDYVDGALYRILTSPGNITSIALSPDELVTSVATGDSVRWIIQITSSGEGEKRRTHILIKPIRQGLKTNMLITTTKRDYHMELESNPDAYIAAVGFNYPMDIIRQDAERIKAKEEEEKVIIAPQVNLDKLYFDYKIEGRRFISWKPVRVFDDGAKTYIVFPEKLHATEAPVLFISTKERAFQFVNYRVKDITYIVDRLFEQAELRVGEKNQEVVRIIRKKRL